MKKIEWICNNTGKEYIDTGVIPNQDTRVVMSVSDAERNAYFFTSWSQEWNILNYSIVNDYEYSSQNMFSAYGDQNTRLPLVENAVIDYDKNVVKFNDVVSHTFNYIAFQSLYSLYLFAQNRKNSVNLPPNHGSFKLHYCKIYDNGVIVRDFIPALDDNDVPCLYEKLEQKFYYNKGSGAFSYAKDYANIEEIVENVSYATQLRTNSKQDDGTDNITGVNWFSYGSIVCDNVYANGNSYIGFGANTADLKVNKRDNAMYNLWREEGTLNGVRFLRIRWGGYANYNVQYNEYKLTYDVLMFETGDICLYMADIPTSNNTGDYKLGDQTYTAPTTDNRWVTFYKTDNGFKVKYEPISFVQYLTKYLIRNEGTLYTIVDGALSELTGELTAELFQTSGVDAVPDGALLMMLSAPEVMCWTNEDTVPVLAATVQGLPTGAHAVISDHIQVDHPSIYGVSSVVATASDGATFLLSFDGGEWMKYNDGTWSVSDIGMTAAELMAIPSTAWSSVINSAQYMQLKATLEGVETVTQVVFNYNNESPTS